MAEVARSVDKMDSRDKPRFYNVKAVVGVLSIDKGFYYIACKGCRKKMTEGRCERCEDDKGTDIVYFFSVLVSDGTKSLWIRVFGSQGNSLLGRTAEELKAIQDAGDESYKKVFENARLKVT